MRAQDSWAAKVEYFSGVVLPWTTSFAVHACVLVALALTADFITTGDSLDPRDMSMVASLAPSARGIAGGAGGPGGGPAPGYYDDDALAAQETQAGGDAPAAPPLDAILNEAPPVSLAGILPAASDVEPRPSAGLEPSPRAASAGATGGGSPKGGGTANSGNDGSANTHVFGIAGRGHKFVYVFDRSASMEGTLGAPLAAAKTQLLASLRDLGSKHQFQIIFYNDAPHFFESAGTGSNLVFATESNKQRAAEFVASIVGDGTTNHEPALAAALSLRPDVIFFLTDAGDPRLKPWQLALLGRLNRGTSINTIEYGNGPQVESDNFLIRLARENGGKHVYVDVNRLKAD